MTKNKKRTRLPKRPRAHAAEDVSRAILQMALPDHWILRNLPGDYGIDAEIELVSTNGEVSGRLFKIQLKSREGVKFRKDRVAKAGPIRASTARYWIALPVPVFLFLVDTRNEEVYWVDAKRALREKNIYDDRTLFLPVHKNSRLSGKHGQALLTWFILIAEHEPLISRDIERLLKNFRDFREFAAGVTDLDPFLSVREDEFQNYQETWEQVSRIRQYFLITKPELHDPSYWVRRAQDMFGDAHPMYYKPLEDAVVELGHAYFSLLPKLKDRILNKERAYWEARDLQFAFDLQVGNLGAIPEKFDLSR